MFFKAILKFYFVLVFFNKAILKILVFYSRRTIRILVSLVLVTISKYSKLKNVSVKDIDPRN